MTDFLEAKRAEIAARIKELKPLVAEYERLEAAAAALAAVPAPATGTISRARVSRNAPRSAPGRRRGRPRGSGVRGRQVLELVKARPGITISEIATSVGINPNYLYRVLPALAKEKLVVKRGKGWHPGAAI